VACEAEHDVDVELAKFFMRYCEWLNRRMSSGDDEAKRSLGFKKITKDGYELWAPPTQRELENSLLLALYDSMETPSIPNLWRLVTELNRRSPNKIITKFDDRRSSSQMLRVLSLPTRSLPTFERHMTRLLAKREVRRGNPLKAE
jgi:hypothetical protein